MLVRGSNHCCCKPPEQCEQRVQFNPYNFDETEKPGTSFGLATVYDSGTSSVTLLGEGSLTTRVTSNPKKIFVHAHILDLNAGSGGITIRRIDSNDSVSLWYLGGTSYELRQGTTVLESITSTSGGEIKLELATPRDATTDVLVYIDDVLEHTETGVAFDMPDVLHLGLVVEDPGGANVRFGYLAVSPCPACTPLTIECHGGKPMPVAWRMVVAGVAGEEDTIPINGFPVCEDPEAPANIEYCDLFNGDYFLVPRSHTLTNSSGGSCNTPTSNAWGEPPEDWPDCDYISAFPMPNVPGYSTPVPEGFVSGLTKYYCTISGSTIDHLCYYPADRSTGSIPGLSGPVDATPAVTLGVFHSIPNSTMTFNVTLTYEYQEDFDPGEGLHAEYESDPIADTTDFLTTGITLNKVSSSGCTDMPNTLFIDPDSEEARGLVQQLSKCGQTCEPPVTPQPGTCYIVDITMVDDNGSRWRWVAPTGVGFNEETGGWEWTGIGVGYDNYVHDDCGLLPWFDIKIHCVELEEGAEKQWVMDITTDDGTSRLTFEWFDEPAGIPGWTGTTNLMCTGEVWDVYAIGPSASPDPVYTFGACSWDACSTPTGLVFVGGISVSCYNNINDPPLTDYGYLLFRPTDLLPVGVSPGSVSGMAYRAILPSSLSGGDASSIFLFVQSGSAMVYIVDANLNLVADMFATIGYSCDPNDGKASLDDTSPIPYYWGSPNPQLTDPFGLCSAGDGNGDWSITF